MAQTTSGLNTFKDMFFCANSFRPLITDISESAILFKNSCSCFLTVNVPTYFLSVSPPVTGRLVCTPAAHFGVF